MKKLLLLFFVLPFIFHNSYSADYFWVGGTGDWSDLTHWSNASGGAGSAYGSLPTTNDNVSFDANSFSAGGQSVSVDVNAFAQNLTFVGVTNNPSFNGASTINIEVQASLTLVATMNHNYAGDYEFTGAGAGVITSSGQTLNQNILINGVGGSWTLADAIDITGEIGLQNGILDFAGEIVNAGSINANNGTAARTIDFGGSTVTINNAGTVLDLRGNTTNLTVTPAGSLITFSNAGDITVETGDEIKTLPSLTFAACTGNIRIRTGGSEQSTKRITFGDISASVNGVDFRVDGNNDDSNTKTFESINLPDNCRYIIGSADGNGGFGGTDHTIINNDFTVGDNGEGDVRGRYIDFLGDFNAGTDSDCRFVQAAQFKGDFNVDGTGGNHLIFDRDADFHQDLNINGTSTLRIDEDFDVAGDINIAAQATVVFDNNATANTVVTGTMNTGVESIVNVGNGDAGTFDFGVISLGSESQIDFDCAASTTTIGDFVLSAYNIVRFNTNGLTTITNTITAAGSCDIWLWLKSLTDGVQANVSFSSAQAVTANIYQDINCSSSNLTNNGGVDLSNNTGITFTAPVAGTTFFWVGSTTGNSKLGTFSTGVNDNWSNPDNWSLTSGNYPGNNSCIPGAHDNVIFNAGSFTAGAGTADLDLFIQACNDFTWTGIPAGCTLDAGLTTTDREFIIFGNVSLHSNLDNQFESLVTFSAHNATTRTITSNGANFFGNIEFDFIGGTWSLIDDFDMNGEQRADVNFRNGTVLANAVTWTIEDDWTVSGGTFTAGTSTIQFDGQAAQNSRQEIRTNSDPFYNLLVLRQTNGGGANDLCRALDPVTINNDFLVEQGGFEDNGNQITGNATGQMIVESNSRVIVGRDNVSTVFPTNFIHANIDLNESGRIYYNSDLTQSVSNIPDYGSIYLQNHKNVLVDKIMDGPISVTNIIFINDYNNFVDNGFQITGDAGEEIQMDPNSQLTLGTAASATLFPTNHTIIDINSPSTVVYNSGLNQTVKTIAGAGDARYWHVIINNAAGVGSSIKTMEGDVIIRGDITINANNELDVDNPNDFEIELMGNWTNDGDFDQHQGDVLLTGGAQQTLISGGSIEDFYNFTANNTSAAGIVIEDDISASNLMTFTDGVIFRGIADNEVVRILDGASVTGASDASHVDGQVEKIGTIAFDFPVGKNAFYRPISIGVPTVASTGFIAEYIAADPHPTFDHNSLAVTIDHISSCEHWILDRSNANLGAATVKLSWNSSTTCGVTHLGDLLVARWDGAVWQDEGNGGTTGAAAAGDVVSSANVTNFSPFTLASLTNNNPLPIKLLNFEAKLNDFDEVDLNWTTLSEVENDYFTIERSSDGVTFEDLIEVDGAGNSSVELNYNGLDRSPLSGVSYYRLRQADFNGLESWSEARSVFLDYDEIKVFPNPSKGEVSFHVPNIFGDGFLKVSDIHGKIICVEAITPGLDLINLTALADGLYFLEFSLEDNSEIQRLIINK